MVKIIYEDIPYGANEGATISSTLAQPISNHSGSDKNKYATLETNLWKLDGSFNVANSSTSQFYWSNQISDDNGNYSTHPTITLVLSSPVSATGLTFNFQDTNYTFKVIWKLNGYTQRTGTYTSDANEYVLAQLVDGFDRIEIEFISSIQPNRFVKISSLLIGQIIRFGDDEIVEAGLISEVNPISSELAIDTFEFSIKDLHKRTFSFQNRQTMTVYQNDTLVGVYFVDSLTQKSHIDYTISCVDSVGVLDTAVYYGGVYNNISANELVHDILGDVVKFDGVPDVTLSGYLPIASARDSLNQVAFALGMAITTYGYDLIHFFSPTAITENTINNSRIFMDGSVEYSPRVSAVHLTAHNYAIDSSVTQAFSGYVSGETTLTFNEPYTDYTITNGTIVDSGANYVVVSAEGEITVSGHKYIDNTSIYVKTNPRTSVLDKENIVEITDATLITSSNALSVLDLLYEYYLNSEKLNQTIIVDKEFAGQQVTSQDAFGNGVKGFITKMNMSFTRHTYADIELVGGLVALDSVAPLMDTFYAGDLLWI